ncbi:MAG: hypothetical protein ABJC26_05960 [Gemmatimonadaceae bacterium]
MRNFFRSRSPEEEHVELQNGRRGLVSIAQWLSCAWAVTSAAIAIAIGELPAQMRAPQVVTTIDSVRADGSVKKVPLRTSNAFELFAVADLAAGFIRSSGGLFGGM